MMRLVGDRHYDRSRGTMFRPRLSVMNAASPGARS